MRSTLPPPPPPTTDQRKQRTVGRNLTFLLALAIVAAAASCTALIEDELSGKPGLGGSAQTGSPTGVVTGGGGQGGTAVGGNGGQGGAAECTVPGDCAGSDTTCRYRTCEGGLCGTEDAAAGTDCTEDGGAVCDGAGSCVECVGNDDCTAPATCVSNQCLVEHCLDGQLSGTETDVDCGGDCPPCQDGERCVEATDCESRFCYDDGGQGGGGGAGGAAAGGGGATGGSGTGGGGSTLGTCSACADTSDCGEAPNTYCASGDCLDQKTSGSSCIDGEECLSGFCPTQDAVCCDSACSEVCESCLGADTGGTDGTCAAVTAGSDPDAECTDQGASSCGANGTGCNGNSSSPDCNLYDNTTECAAASCTADVETFASTCDGAGTCVPGATNVCVPYTCDINGTACETTCTSPAQCAAGYDCTSGSCTGLGADGTICTSGNQCQSSNCVDGYCCDTGCTGICQACAAALTSGSNGVCAPVTAGTDPDGNCGANQSCDGAGTCKLDNGQSCTAGSECVSNQCVDDFCCDSSCTAACRGCAVAGFEGTCSVLPDGSLGNPPCTPFVCDGVGASCPSTCAGDVDCAAGNYCAINTCTPKKAAGTACLAGNECLSGFCVDDVCCNNGCSGTCRACDSTRTGGADGTCVAIPSGTDPDGECGVGSTCNGAGACLKAVGQACTLPGECLTGFCVDGFCCTSSCGGTCQACSAVKTGGSDGVCAFAPAGSDPDSECPANTSCDGAGACHKDDGQPCSLGTECITGDCVDGVCCSEPCDGVCEGCTQALTTSPDGVCSPIPAGTDPENECGAGSNCNGSNGCLKAEGQTCNDGTECLSTHCVDGFCCDTDCAASCRGCAVAGLEGTCSLLPDGAPGSPSCDPYLCDGVGAICPASCATSADCAATHYCSGTSCIPRLSDGTSCSQGEQCLSGSCTDGVCCDTACAGTCRACLASLTGGTDGTCDYVTAGTDPETECPSGQICDGAGTCSTKPDGLPCGGDAECTSLKCVDGVCCDTACSGVCEACVATKTGGSDGVCAPVTENTDPDSECLTSTCDGIGGCKQADGSPCSQDPECTSDHCVDGFCCDTACSGSCDACNLATFEGTCTPLAAGSAGSPDCAPYVCDGTTTTCPGSCTDDSDCSGTAYCDGVACQSKKSDGLTCTAGKECVSGSCVDGVCCATACGGACEACSALKTGGTDGICTPIPYGSDPDGECGAGLACDGSGLCRKDDGQSCGVNSECLTGFCVDGVCCATACTAGCEACSAAKTGGVDGLCTLIPSGDDPDGECGPGAVCNGSGVCLDDDGQDCTTGAECLSGQCVDSYCCDVACDGNCQACDSSLTGGADGVCGFVTPGTDPDGNCGAGAACDASGICKTENGGSCLSGTDCASAFCVDDVCCDTLCDGTCQACSAAKNGVADGTCGPVIRGEDFDGECGNKEACNGIDACASVDGEICTLPADCVSGFCVDGFCCDTACDGSCEACDSSLSTGADGVCAVVPEGTDPDDDCPGLQTCNALGACGSDPDGTPCTDGADCASGRCIEGVCCNTLCDGTCESCLQTNTGVGDGTCSPISFDSDPDGECGSNERCDGARACKRVDGETCGTGDECLSTSCADGFCCDLACGGPCEACDSALTGGDDGVCSFITSGTDPDTECALNERCDGSGVCKMVVGEVCTNDDQCLGNECVDGFCCDSACDGICQACSLTKNGVADGACGFVTPDTDPDLECGDGSLCDGAGTCKKEPGEPCGDDAECLGNECVDGFCCDAACDGLCEACSAAKNGVADGACGPVQWNTDPDLECSSVERCDGTGVCRFVQGEGCGGDDDCLNSTCVDGFCCDSLCGGTCESCDGSETIGDDGVCSEIIPGTDPIDECPASRVCQAGSVCDFFINGQPCTANNQCISDLCVDGVCCDSLCGSLCASCLGADTGGSDGTCSFITYRTDPYGECPTDQLCDGAGVCKTDDGVGCATGADCLSGFCPDPDLVCCDAACDSTCEACTASRNGGTDGQCDYIGAGDDPDDECLGPATCSGVGTCEKPLGEGCVDGTECASGLCVDGVCCNEICADNCESCLGTSTGGPSGTCDFVTTTTDPDDECPGALNYCDGQGVCKVVDGGPCTDDADCFSDHCPADDLVCCNSACTADCSACTAAKTGQPDGTCALVPAYDDPDSDCTGGQLCDGAGTCKDDDGVSCNNGNSCVSGFCPDGYCCESACNTRTCEACSAALTDADNGVCAAITAYTDPESECAATNQCDGDFGCKLVDAQTCAKDVDCISGHCVDGVCCDAPCAADCWACLAAWTDSNDGECAPVTDGLDPQNECPGVAAVCDGTGSCYTP